MRLAIAVVAGLLALPGLAAAQDQSGRYTLTPKDGGYVRLDTQTGQVSTCSGPADNLVCRSAPDERLAMQGEVDRLTAENDTLRKELEEAKAKIGLTGTDGNPGELTVPSDQDVDKAFNFIERMIKRFKGLIEELRKESAEPTPL